MSHASNTLKLDATFTSSNAPRPPARSGCILGAAVILRFLLGDFGDFRIMSTELKLYFHCCTCGKWFGKEGWDRATLDNGYALRGMAQGF